MVGGLENGRGMGRGGIREKWIKDMEGREEKEKYMHGKGARSGHCLSCCICSVVEQFALERKVP